MSVQDLDVTTQLIGLVVSLITLGCAIWLLASLRRGAALRFRAWRNRSRHQDLARQYAAADEDDRFLIAQEMMMRDRVRKLPNENYPTVWDYYIPPGRVGLELAQRRQKDRQADLERLRSRIRAK